MRPAFTSLLLSALGGNGCGSASVSTAISEQVPTLRVSNTGCSADGCPTIEVRLFDLNLTVPQPVWGSKVVGQIRGPAGCLAFPAQWTYTVVGFRDTFPSSKADTTVFKLGAEDSIYLVMVDSAVFHSGPNRSIRPAVAHKQGLARLWTARSVASSASSEGSC